jgi:peroxiredoxin Q/BCP
MAAVASLLLFGALLAAAPPCAADLPASGTPAPDFTLPGTDGSTFRLADQIGRHNVLVALLLETVCPFCQRHVAALNQVRAQWAADYDAQVVFVKPDTAEAVKAFALGVKADNLPPLWIDSDKTVPQAYGVGKFQFHGAQRYLPATILIDKAGLVRFTYASKDNRDRPTIEGLTAELKKLPDRAELAEGKPLPPFALPDQDGAIQRLADHLGKQPLVLTFYPKDMTGGCTREACSLRDNQDALRATGAVVYGVSVDTPASHKEFIAKDKLNYPLLADSDKGYTRWLGLLGGNGMANRVTIVVDKQGIVRKIDRAVKVDSHGQDLLAVLKQIAAAG